MISTKNKEERIKLLDKQIEELSKRLDYELNKPTKNESFERFSSRIDPLQNERARLQSERRMLTDDYTLSPLSEYGNVMKLKDFANACKDQMFMDYDGYGYYVKDDQETNLMIIPSDVTSGKYRKEFENIIWFNK
jgi:hypothetical protein